MSQTSSAKPCRVDTNPEFFSIPIKKRSHNRPVVEVTFNNQHTFDMIFDTGATTTLITRPMAAKLKLPLVGTQKMLVADGTVVTLLTALAKFQKIDDRIKTDMVVLVAPPTQDIGLLGQDFYEGYNVILKENTIEFHRQPYLP
ncbi:MAG TPA: hypothetical protein DDZ80_23755 [Cyanobacteria bacterium UBA8803]|nr:hypothetical protein [Cyanobacteria bacterium UBA9273]HBL61335.1 hypothetical protein [Cyanobacteria bacterium UBA8803]